MIDILLMVIVCGAALTAVASRPFANCLIAVTARPLKCLRVRRRPIRGWQKSRSTLLGRITTDRMMMSDHRVGPRRAP